jgi:hypothetical protein
MAYGTIQAYRTSGGGQAHFGASAAPLFGHTTYIAIAALILNLAVSAVLSVVFKGFGLRDGYDETRPADYVADPVPVPVPAAARARKGEPAPARSAGATQAREASRASGGTAAPVSGAPWPPAAGAAEAPAPAEAVNAPEAPAAGGTPAAGETPAAMKAPPAEDDATIVFDVPASLAGAPQSRERLPRRR